MFGVGYSGVGGSVWSGGTVFGVGVVFEAGVQCLE